MTDEVFEKILSDAKEIDVSEILLFLNGEPFLFPRLFDWLQRLREENCTTVIFTNASHLTEAKASELVSFSDVVRVVVFSIGGIDQATYKAVTGLDYNVVKRNITAFLGLNAGKIETAAHIPYMSQTCNFIEEWRMQWQGKMDTVSATAMFNYAGLVHDELELTENEDHAKAYCGRLNHLAILWDGRVCLCCMDMEGRVILGNVRTHSLADIFYSELARHYRRLHREKRFNELPLCCDCNMNIVAGRVLQ